jgi:hypothetical protein
MGAAAVMPMLPGASGDRRIVLPSASLIVSVMSPEIRTSLSETNPSRAPRVDRLHGHRRRHPRFGLINIDAAYQPLVELWEAIK